MSHFLTQAEVVLMGHLLNPIWHSREQRRARRGAASEKAVMRYLNRTLKAPSEAPALPAGDSARTVWTLWLQGMDQAPAIVQACVSSMQRQLSAAVEVLDLESVLQRISLPAYILDKWRAGKIRPAHFADICRVELLYEYGGVWADSTAFFTADLPKWLWEAPFFVYGAGHSLHGSYAFIQNCFIRAQKGSLLLAAWREAIFQYWKQENSAVDYFVHQLLFKWAVQHTPGVAQAYADMPQLEQEPTHLLWFQKGALPYDKAQVQAICSQALFQKTEYKSALAKNPPAGSVAEWILNGAGHE